MVKLTERDKKIFEFLFKLRYARSDQISKYINCTMTAFYERIKNLLKYEYLESEWVERINRKVYLNGIMVRKDHEERSYQRKVKINRYTMPHHLLINDIYIYIIKELGFDVENVTTEREMYWKKTGILDKRRKFKMPDLVIKKDEDLIAIEVEKSMKNRTLLSNVFTNYSLYTSYYCVRYICETKGIKEHVIRVAEEENKPFIKAYTADEFFNGVDVIGL